MKLRIISIFMVCAITGVFPALVGAQDETTCPELVQTAYEITQEACEDTGRDEACYGNTLVSAEPQPEIEGFQFEAPGDVAEVSEIATLRLSSMDLAAEAWGMSLIRIQADLPDTSPSYVEMLLFGNVEIENRGGKAAETDSSDTPYRAMQAFYFTSGTEDRPCDAAPDSGILIQTPEGEGEITVLVNEVVIELGSTAYLQAQPSDEMVISVVEGEAAVTADGTTVVAPAGMLTTIPLDADGTAAGAPTEPQPYDAASLAMLPIALLSRQIVIAPAIDSPIDSTVSPETTPEGSTTLIMVSNQPDWVDSGITVRAGQSFTIEAHGTMNPCRDTYPDGEEYCIFFGPEGATGVVNQHNEFGAFPALGQRFMALLGRIGNGEPFYVGTGGTFTVIEDGTLWFTPNDNQRTDNQGAFTVQITVHD